MQPVGGLVRRRLLLAGATGAAASLLPFLHGRAAATIPDDDDSDDAGGAGDTQDSTISSGSSTGAETGGSAIGATSGSDGGGFSGTGDSTNSPIGDTTEDSTGGSVGEASEVTTGGSDTEPAATTTTAPPKRPTDADIDVLVFVQSLELAARDLYRAASAAGVFEGATAEVMNAIGEDHEAYAQAISGFIGRDAPNVADADLFGEFEADFTGPADAAATAARRLEDSLVATNIEAIGTLMGTEGSAMIASMVVIEARHATVLAHVAGITDLAEQLTSVGEPIAAPAT